ncbi:hypothetical protein PoB_003188800 [Plakobranchus ocellatus]|uniref:Uncharacterized protein n=1 Tax=Plakobranchus ocellatus TaxID=259542 RepID=A0AAV4AFQ5_9GAST|nr:hypothetical protein PoB_003188800 [Plakobranchus ocellatus]
MILQISVSLDEQKSDKRQRRCLSDFTMAKLSEAEKGDLDRAEVKDTGNRPSVQGNLMVSTDPSTFARNSINMIYTPREKPINYSGTVSSSGEGEIEEWGGRSLGLRGRNKAQRERNGDILEE